MKIVQVQNKKQLNQFIQFQLDLYKDCEFFCPPLISDELKTLDSTKNPAFEVCEAAYFMAVDESGRVLGRIAGIVNHRANSYWNVKKTRFGWFDFVDDLSVSKALLDAVAEWGRSMGMETLNGPVGFSDMDHEGLLLDHYDTMQVMAAIYNFPYYVKHYEAYGFEKETDWLERRLIVPEQVPEKMSRVAEIAKERSKLRVLPVRSSKDVLKYVGYGFFDLIDECYKDLYNYSPLTRRQKEAYSKEYFPILNYDFVTLVVNEKDELVCVGVTMPNLSKVLRKTKGSLKRLGWFHLWRTMHAKKHDEVDLLLFAAKEEYQRSGAVALLFSHQLPNYFKYGVKYANVTNVLETNDNSGNIWDGNFEVEYTKRHRAYIKAL